MDAGSYVLNLERGLMGEVAVIFLAASTRSGSHGRIKEAAGLPPLDPAAGLVENRELDSGRVGMFRGICKSRVLGLDLFRRPTRSMAVFHGRQATQWSLGVRVCVKRRRSTPS